MVGQIFVIHENDTWLEPLRGALAELDLPYEEWHLDQGLLDLTVPPPEGVFYNRMSASSHSRGHRYAPEYTGCVLAWLEYHGRRVINSSRALRLELSKIAQYAALQELGIRTPHTVAAVGRNSIIEAAKRFDHRPFMSKHNRGGNGLGVRLFHDRESLVSYIDGPGFEPSVDGVTLIQEYIEAPEPFITRVEFVGGRFLYAVRVNTSDGFELCPADACREDDDHSENVPPLFHIIEGFQNPLVSRYQHFLETNGIHIAGIEFILDRGGAVYTYDVNTNTNYNSEAEAETGISGMRAIAAYLGDELACLETGRLDSRRARAS